MTKEEIIKIINRQEDEYTLTIGKKIYAGIVYFYKRELQKDHYFTTEDGTLYYVPHDKDNYNPSVTLTASKPDSFQMSFEDAQIDGIIEKMGYEQEIHEAVFPSNYKPITSEIDIDSIKEEIDQIILKLVELKSKL